MLKRKIDIYLKKWKNDPDKLPLIVRGARQIGKTASIENFAKDNYKSIVEINFVLQKQFKGIFDDGFEVDTIIKNITLINPNLEFIAGDTLIFFDEIQDCINCATSLKSFKLDGRYDVICSGSLMGINYNEIESNSVGYKEDYNMHSMDFEEFLWAKGYKESQIEDLYNHMLQLKPLSTLEFDVISSYFKEYMIIGGMPAIVNSFIENKNYSGTIEMDFFVRDANSLVPVEVKANDGATVSLNNLINKDTYSDIKYGIKLCNKNIGFNGKFYTFPYFLTFLLKRYLTEKGR